MQLFKKKYIDKYSRWEIAPVRKWPEGSIRMRTKQEIKKELELEEPVPGERLLDDEMNCYCDSCTGLCQEEWL